jgi:hypothetical protein
MSVRLAFGFHPVIDSPAAQSLVSIARPQAEPLRRNIGADGRPIETMSPVL